MLYTVADCYLIDRTAFGKASNWQDLNQETKTTGALSHPSSILATSLLCGYVCMCILHVAFALAYKQQSIYFSRAGLMVIGAAFRMRPMKLKINAAGSMCAQASGRYVSTIPLPRLSLQVFCVFCARSPGFDLRLCCREYHAPSLRSRKAECSASVDYDAVHWLEGQRPASLTGCPTSNAGGAESVSQARNVN